MAELRRWAEPALSSLSVVIVTHDHREAVRGALPALAAQLDDGDQLIVVDNDSSDGTADAVRELAPDAIVIDAGANLGFAAGCNRGASTASGELLCFLNPDAVPAPGFREAIERPLADGRGWAAWQGLVTAEGGRVSTPAAGWSTSPASPGRAELERPCGAGERGRPQPRSLRRSEPGFVSGACLAIPRATFERVGGFAEEFFLYHEDVDLSLRLRLAGQRLGVEPAARVEHAYEFAKGPAKWRHLERNRWATLIRTYPAALLALLAPALVATELALVPVSAAGGWFGQKLLAWGDTLLALPRLLARAPPDPGEQDDRRGGVRAGADRRPRLPLSGTRRALARCCAARSRAYWSVVLALLRAAD